jgi:hypothetical protein
MTRGKFEWTKDPQLAEYLYECSLAEYLDAEIGNSVSGTWHGLLLIDHNEMPHFSGLTTPAKLGDSYILTEDSQGFVGYAEYPNEIEARKAWAQIVKQFGDDDD